MIDEEQIKEALRRRLEEGETLLYLSCPKDNQPTFPFAEVMKSVTISVGIAILVFLTVWSKYHNFDAARNIGCWFCVVLVVGLLVHSFFYYRKTLNIITVITDRAILKFEYQGSGSSSAASSKWKDAVSVESSDFRLRRISFDTIESVNLLEKANETGDIVYSLKGPESKKLLHTIGVTDCNSARNALPQNLIKKPQLPDTLET